MAEKKCSNKVVALDDRRRENGPEQPEDRAARVAALKRAVNDGSYRIRTKDLALDIVDSLMSSLD